MAITRANKIIICDTEAERNLDWKDGQLIWTKDSQKLWIIDGGAFVLTDASSLAGYQLLIAGATNNDIVTTDAVGQTKDSGKAFSTDGTLAANSDNLIPTEKAVKTYANSLVVGLWDDRGSFDASGGAYPSGGGSGTAGTILKGDIWTISVAGTLPTGQVVEVGDVVRALSDTPGNTQANWSIQQNNIGYTAENSANKTDTVAGNTASSIKYLSVKGYYDWLLQGITQALSAKATPVDADAVVIEDSADSNKTKKTTWANIKATLKTYFDVIYFALTNLDTDVTLSANSDAKVASQKAVKTYIDSRHSLYFSCSVFTPAANTTYFLGGNPAYAPLTSTNASRRIVVLKTGTLTTVGIQSAAGNTPAADSHTIKVKNVTTGNSITLTTALIFVSGLYTGLKTGSLAVNAGDLLEVQWVTPTSYTGTAPTGVTITGWVLVE